LALEPASITLTAPLAATIGKAEGEKVPGEHRHWMFRSRHHNHLGEAP